MPQSQANKKSIKTIKKTQVAKRASVKTAKPKSPKKAATGLSLPVYDLAGRQQGTVSLPKEIFGQEPNKKLLSQAYRVYLSRTTPKTSSTKTRAEVAGGGRKPWRQKGTGHARAGSIRSPLWVGGGVTFGPKPGKTVLTLPKKMRKKALVSALSLAQKEGNIRILSNIGKMEPKTKTAASLLKKLSIYGRTLIVLGEPKTNVLLATRNIPQTEVETLENLNAYRILSTNNLVLDKSTIEKFKI